MGWHCYNYFGILILEIQKIVNFVTLEIFKDVRDYLEDFNDFKRIRHSKYPSAREINFTGIRRRNGPQSRFQNSCAKLKNENQESRNGNDSLDLLDRIRCLAFENHF